MSTSQQKLPAVCGLIININPFLPSETHQTAMVKFRRSLSEEEREQFLAYVRQELGVNAQVTETTHNNGEGNSFFMNLMIKGHDPKQLCELAKIYTRRTS